MKVSTIANSTALDTPFPSTATKHLFARRFSSTVTFRQSLHAEALKGALRLAASFSYLNDATYVLFNSPFLRLPNLSVLTEDSIPPKWLNNCTASHPSRYCQYSSVLRDLVDFFNSKHLLGPGSYSHPKPSLWRWVSLCWSMETQTWNIPHAFLRLTPTGTAALKSRLPDLPSTSSTPETLPHTALAPSIVPTPCPAPLPAQSSHAFSVRLQHFPSFSTSSDSKRSRLPGKSTFSGSRTGCMSHFSDSTRPLATSSLGWLLFKLLCHRQSSLSAPVSYPRLAPILILPIFAIYGVDFLC